MIHTVMEMNLKDVMLNEAGQSQETLCPWFHLYEGPGVVKFIKVESVAAGGHGENGERLFNW